MPDDKSLPDEVAKLTEAVHELRDREVAAELQALREEIGHLRAAKGAPAPGCCGHHHCGCIVHWYWPNYTYPHTVTVGSLVCTGPNVTTIAGTGGSVTLSSGTGAYTATN